MNRLLTALRTRTARFILIALLLASIPLYVLSYTLIPMTGDWGFNGTGYSSAARDVVPHGSAWNAGIRDGDIYTIPRAEFMHAQFPAVHERMLVQVRRGNRVENVYVTAQPAQIHFRSPEVIRAVVNGCLLLFTLLIIACAWNTEFVPLIVAMLTMTIFNAATDHMPTFATDGWMAASYDSLQFASGFAFGACIFFLTVLCALVTGSRSRALTFLIWITFAEVLLDTMLAGIGIPSVLIALSSTGFKIQALFGFMSILTPVIVLAVARIVAPMEQRSRMLWLFWGFFPFWLGITLANLGDLWFVPPTIFNHPGVNTIARALELSAPIALFYGLLVRRTVDIGFVFNRVAVYGFISALVLGVFVLLEYLAGHFIEARGAASWAIQLSIAMLIGIGARYLHGSVDRFVDRVFFAKRHADEFALRRFAQEADAFTSSDSLLDRALEVVNSHSETAGAAIYLCGESDAKIVRGGAPFPDEINIDDPLLVALRRWGEPVDTHDVKTEFLDGMVFPMNARGKLIGALACRTKRDTTAFAPDERESLLQVAQSLGHALEALGSTSGPSSETLAQAILSTQQMVLKMHDALLSAPNLPA